MEESLFSFLNDFETNFLFVFLTFKVGYVFITYEAFRSSYDILQQKQE